MMICYTYYMNIDDKHNMNMQKNDNTNFFYQRTILNSLNLSVGILITAVMIFRMKK
jgi:hypothetical protein